MDPTYPLFPILAIIGFALVLIPLPWHLRASNSGTSLFIIWTAIGCLNQFVNSIVWHNNVVDWAPVWCDISTRLTVGITVAIPAASLCINRRLYMIASCRSITFTLHEKRRAVFVDLTIGLGIPAIQMALQFIVQGHRYDIWEDIGCLPTTINTPAAYPLSFLWPNIITTVSVIYCILTLHTFMIRRAQFAQLVSCHSSLSINHYFRLLCLATSEILLTIPLSSYGLYLNTVSHPMYHWKSWADTHSNFYTLGIFPAAVWRSNHLFTVVLELDRWLLVLCAFVFFSLFGLAEDARKNYLAIYRHILHRLASVLPSSRTYGSHKGSIPPLKGTFETSPTSLTLTRPSSMSNMKRSSIQSFASTAYTETVQFEPDTPDTTFDTFDEYELFSKISASRLSRATV